MNKKGIRQNILNYGIVRIILALIFIIVAFRVILPFGLKNYINKRIDAIEGFYGNVEAIELSFVKNIYQIKNIRIIADSSKIPKPFFQAESLSVTFNWADLFKGGVVGSGVLYSPVINYVQSKKQDDRQAPEDSKSFTDVVNEMFPFRIDIFKIKDGEVHYSNRTQSLVYDFFALDINGEIENLTNSKKLSSSMFVSAQFNGQAMDKGIFQVNLLINPLSKTQEFSLNGYLKNLNLVSINDFIKVKTKLTFNSGMLDFSTKLNSGGERIKGFAVMDIQNLDITSAEELIESEESLSRKFLKGLSEAASEFLEGEDDRVRAKVVISTPIQEGKPDLVVTIINALRSAFSDAFISRLIPLTSP